MNLIKYHPNSVH